MVKGKLSIESINARLKAGKIGVSVVARGDRLYLQATLPPKPGKISPVRRIALGIYANQDGLGEAEALALKLGSDLARGQFDWEDWIKDAAIKANDAQSLISRYRKFLFDTQLTGSPERKDKLWRRRHFGPGLKWIPEGPLTKDSLIIAALHFEANTRSRQMACIVLGQFAHWAGVECDLKPYRGRYSAKDVERDIPSDAEIVAAIENIPNPSWRWVAGMMATYGLRDHECWYVEWEYEEDERLGQVPICRVTDGKTHGRISRPLPLEWVSRFGLTEGEPPKISAIVNSDYGEKTSKRFKRYKVPFVPYDLRHAYGIRSTVVAGLPVSVSAAHMGHSPHVHLERYNKHITQAQLRDAYGKLDHS